MGRNKVKVSHLQYADDTIFTCPAKMSNIIAIKHILRNFELVSGLKVNFQKCAILGINTDNLMVENMARYLLCVVGKIPFSYLGMNVGINHRLARSWSMLIDKVRRRINSWKGKNLSFGGRITLIQAVLSAVPIYYLSFYRIPKNIIRALTGLQRRFLWGVVRKTKKSLGLGGARYVWRKNLGGWGLEIWRNLI